ncbi:MAG: lipoate protein ligase C-terminal domain-containing protein [Ginsengibacter sp.]
MKNFGDFFNEKDIAEIETALKETTHDEESIRKTLGNYNIGEYFTNMTSDDLVMAMF